MINPRFKEGDKIKAIYLPQNKEDGVTTITRGGLVTKISVVMENGQRADVPWFAVWHGDKISEKYNAALVEGCALMEKDDE